MFSNNVRSYSNKIWLTFFLCNYKYVPEHYIIHFPLPCTCLVCWMLFAGRMRSKRVIPILILLISSCLAINILETCDWIYFFLDLFLFISLTFLQWYRNIYRWLSCHIKPKGEFTNKHKINGTEQLACLMVSYELSNIIHLCSKWVVSTHKEDCSCVNF